MEEYSTRDLDYLQRTGLEPPGLQRGAPETWAPVALRRQFRIAGIGRFEKQAVDAPGRPFRLVTEDLLIGLSTYSIPLAFLCRGEPGRIAVHLGTWLPAGAAPSALDHNQRILRAALDSAYPSVEVVEAEDEPERWAEGGLVLGIPTAKPPDGLDGALPLDRLVRALAGARWASLVLAQPVEETVVRDVRLRAINELRAVQTHAKTAGVPSPLADHYGELLRATLQMLTEGQATGAWRTAVYLLGDAAGYYRLASVWRGIFSGERSLPEPVRVWDRAEVADLATRWAMPDPLPARQAAPGRYRLPFEHQTLLTSAQLAAYVHLPRLETNGFMVTSVPDFDAVPPPVPAGGIRVGRVVERNRETMGEYALARDALTRHAFVAGVTGSGKTNTIFHLLRQTVGLAAPFLVLEPAKREYRALLDDAELGSRLRVFTLGDENVSPLRLNPFEVPDGIPVGVHLDLLRAVFSVGFGLWTPLPQVLEICLHRVYEDRGWDVTSNVNRRLDGRSDRAASFPTLSDLVAKVEEVAGQLGYEERVTSDIRAALRTRLNSLRSGGKGRMLDVQRSVSMDQLLSSPTVLELEGLGDDDDKAFVMGLLLIRLAEHRRAQGEARGLRHLLVVEEAHRLLASTGPRRDEAEADARRKAVDTFGNLLSEIRAYGQAVIVADQIPVKLAPEVIKNTNLKIAHRVVAGDDRAVLAAAMAMSDQQARSLATLRVGRAAVFADGDDAPLLVQVPPAKGGAGQAWPTDERVRRLMRPSSPVPDVAAECAAPGICEAARRVAEDGDVRRTFGRVVLSLIADPAALDRLWPDLVAAVEPMRQEWIESEPLLRDVVVHAAQWLAGRRGAQGGWTYADVDDFATALRRALLSRGRDGHDSAVESFRELALSLAGRRYGPFLACRRIWRETEIVCICRYPVADAVASQAFSQSWRDADAADGQREDGGRPRTWVVCQDAAYQIVEFPEPDWPEERREPVAAIARRTALCFGQQALAADPTLHPRTRRGILADLLRESGHA